MLDNLVVILRAAIFLSLLQTSGVVLFIFLFNHYLTSSKAPIYFLGIISAFSGATFIVVRYLFEPVRLTGTLNGFIDISIHEFLITSNFGISQFLRFLGSIIIGVSLLLFRRNWNPSSFLGVILIASSFSFIGHVGANEQQWILGILLTIHLLSAAFWFGSLVPLHLVCTREAIEAGKLIKHFSKIATYIVPLILFAGLGLAIILLPNFSSLKTPYGILLISKIIGFTVLMGIAALNKFKLSPSISAGNRNSCILFKRLIALEILLITIVLYITATMTTLYSPEV
ncbi:MAG: hypothetical protein CMM56_06090 [Rhodospirillaceae bacterium]|nr:hypothetical protein [Rhodospirillaceae bacterium]|tara:strand:- start:235 stop:1089 length:855 start_codon:yes stop_codon:yes gene_type:complete